MSLVSIVHSVVSRDSEAESVQPRDNFLHSGSGFLIITPKKREISPGAPRIKTLKRGVSTGASSEIKSSGPLVIRIFSFDFLHPRRFRQYSKMS